MNPMALLETVEGFGLACLLVIFGAVLGWIYLMTRRSSTPCSCKKIYLLQTQDRKGFVTRKLHELDCPSRWEA